MKSRTFNPDLTPTPPNEPAPCTKQIGKNFPIEIQKFISLQALPRRSLRPRAITKPRFKNTQATEHRLEPGSFEPWFAASSLRSWWICCGKRPATITPRNMIKAWADSSSKWPLPIVGTGSQLTSDLATEAVYKLSDQNVTQPQAAPRSQHIIPSQVAVPSVAPPPMVNTSTEPQQQLGAIMSVFTVIRRIVEQIAGRQEQMSRDLTTLQAAQHDVSQKAAAPAQTAAIHAPAGKKVPKPAHSEIPEQPAAASLQTAPGDTPSTGDKSPRPPLPLVPPSAETPSPAR
jgi:hypothetical protein